MLGSGRDSHYLTSRLVLLCFLIFLAKDALQQFYFTDRTILKSFSLACCCCYYAFHISFLLFVDNGSDISFKIRRKLLCTLQTFRDFGLGIGFCTV